MCQQGLTFTVQVKSEQTVGVSGPVWLHVIRGHAREALPQDSKQTVTPVLITGEGQTTPDMENK